MSGSIDVLAVMDATVRARSAEWFRNHDKYFGRVAGIDKELDKLKASANEAIEARAAVAELIEAATPFAKLECLGASIESSPDDAIAIITIGTIKRVRAALARVQGGAP